MLRAAANPITDKTKSHSFNIWHKCFVTSGHIFFGASGHNIRAQHPSTTSGLPDHHFLECQTPWSYTTLFLVCSCSGGNLTVDCSGCWEKFLLIFFEIILELVETYIMYRLCDVTWSCLTMASVCFLQGSTWSPYWSSTTFWQAHCVRATVSTQKWNGLSKRLTENIYPNLTNEACGQSLWPKTSSESKRHPVKMPLLLLKRGTRL